MFGELLDTLLQGGFLLAQVFTCGGDERFLVPDLLPCLLQLPGGGWLIDTPGVRAVSLGLSGDFTGADVRRAMEGHVLASAVHVGTYSLNPDVPA